MRKRELQAIIERQAAEIADLRRRVEELEARPIGGYITITREVPAPRLDPWQTPPNDTGHPPPWEWNKIMCGSGTVTVRPELSGALYWEPATAE